MLIVSLAVVSRPVIVSTESFAQLVPEETRSKYFPVSSDLTHRGHSVRFNGGVSRTVSTSALRVERVPVLIHHRRQLVLGGVHVDTGAVQGRDRYQWFCRGTSKYLKHFRVTKNT